MNIGNGIACVALRIGKHYLSLGVVEQQADEFTARISRCSQYSYSYHFYSIPFFGARTHNNR